MHSEIARNPGMPLDLGWVAGVRINTEGVRARAADLSTRRSVKKDEQLAWLFRAVTFMDLTTLSGDDSPGRVARLCTKADQPVRSDLITAAGLDGERIKTGAVCVYHENVAAAVDALRGTGIPVAAVSTGFPDGQNPFPLRLKEIEASVRDGAEEIDIVITRAQVMQGDWETLYSQLKAYRKACGPAHLKAILATGDLNDMDKIAKASLVAMMAGSDFIKTSTGKEKLNANLAVSLVMLRMIRDYHERTGHMVGFKPAGGIVKAKDAIAYMVLMKEELGDAWLRPELFRFGASSLLGDVERQIEHGLTGRYSAVNRHPMP